MKKYCLIKDGKVTQIGELPVNFDNVSNFHALPNDEIKKYGWLPVETVSDNKEIQENIEYIIEENIVKEMVSTRDKTQEEIEKELQHQIESKWHSIRFQRDNLLKNSDLNILPDKWDEMSSETKLLWSLYRKQLRDIPQTFENPDSVIWPTKP